jgi:serine/threonine protein kinase
MAAAGGAGGPGPGPVLGVEAPDIIAPGSKFDLLSNSGTTVQLSIESSIGQGGFASVWKGTLEGFGQVIVKRIPKTIQNIDLYIKSELNIVRNLGTKRNAANVTGCDPLINCFYGIIEQGEEQPVSELMFTNPSLSPSNYYLLYEFIEGKNLEEFVPELLTKIYQGDIINSLIHQLLNAIYHMHQLNIAHMDIKPLNIMITPDNKLKLIDFGLARRVTPDFVKFSAGTVEYLPPETFLIAPPPVDLKTAILQGLLKKVDVKKIDMFSIGCVIYYMMTGLQLTSTRAESILRTKTPEVVIEGRYSEFIPFIKKCLDINETLLEDFEFIKETPFKIAANVKQFPAPKKTKIIQILNKTKTPDISFAQDRYSSEEALVEWCRLTAIPEDRCVIPLTAKQSAARISRAVVNAALIAPAVAAPAAVAVAPAAAAAEGGAGSGSRRAHNAHNEQGGGGRRRRRKTRRIYSRRRRQSRVRK